jgi:hypothetical protein
MQKTSMTWSQLIKMNTSRLRAWIRGQTQLSDDAHNKNNLELEWYLKQVGFWINALELLVSY